MIIPVLQCRSFFLVTVLTCIITLATGCATFGGPKIEKPVDDLTITKSIERKMAADPELNSLNIKIVSRQGEVTMTGTTPSREIKTRLIKLALSVQGVRSVKDNINIKKQ